MEEAAAYRSWPWLGPAEVLARLARDGDLLLATGKGGEARALADALTRLHPTSRAAWELAATVAAALGDASAAERARIEAAALAHRDAPFASVGVASA